MNNQIERKKTKQKETSDAKQYDFAFYTTKVLFVLFIAVWHF